MEEKKRVSFYNYLNNLLKIDTQICSPLYLCLALYVETFVHHNKGILVRTTVVLSWFSKPSPTKALKTAPHFKGASANI